MASSPTFSPPCGPVTGWTEEWPGEVPLVRATGIRYAAARRFEAPLPAPDRTEVFEATSWSPACPQAPMPVLEEVLGGGIGELGVDEDCQRLSITLPGDLAPGEQLPVMVWIHGGSYVSAAGDAAVMDPAPLVAEQRVVAVNVTFRLGLFGFLGGSDARPANLGLLDIVEAFRWVQRNISAFGGDPAQITAYGQSAGAHAIAQLMALPEAPSLFRRAIIQSAPLNVEGGREEMQGRMLEATAELTAESPVAAVVGAQAAALRASAEYGLQGAMSFSPQHGSDPLPTTAGVLAGRDANAPAIDLLIGYTSEEALLFVPRIPATKRLSELPVVGRPLTKAVVSALTWLVYRRDAARFARRHLRAGGHASTYVVSWRAPHNVWGACHMIDLPLLFGSEQTWSRAPLVRGASWAEIDRVGKRMRAVWADFARGTLPAEADSIPGAASFRRRG
ncbi:carboxylesterase family protein [Pseudoclavibacter terrae]|uniref:carboxylesterase family protein n=1 Tax=Pseudoclavibacter terrae TaxID=1530195 RepID=UPI00232A8D15|nr:carboxylesterase family protein [Pseudoclavibacter terrae]